jgi:RimJ/RimL family protein N-acetyltransferase
MPRSIEPLDLPLSAGDFTVRPFKLSDVDAIKAAGNDVDITRHTFMPPAADEDVARQWLSRAVHGWEHGVARLAIVPSSAGDDRCVGQIGLVLADHPTGNAEAVYWLLPEARGRSWAARALRLVSDWGFESLGLERIAVLVDLDNPASQRTAEKAGFTREGVLRGYERHPRLGRVDVWSFSRLATD